MINLKIREVDKNTVYSDRGFDLNPDTLVEISITDHHGNNIKIKPSGGSFLMGLWHAALLFRGKPLESMSSS